MAVPSLVCGPSRHRCGFFQFAVGRALALAVRSPLHLAISMIHHGLGVAVIAARRDFLAPDPRIERVIAPFDVAVFTHDNALRLKMDWLNTVITSLLFTVLLSNIAFSSVRTSGSTCC